mgnify:CR=1 FL=1
MVHKIFRIICAHTHKALLGLTFDVSTTQTFYELFVAFWNQVVNLQIGLVRRVSAYFLSRDYCPSKSRIAKYTLSESLNWRKSLPVSS